ncbi:hypothetical protein GCM10028773_14970 [Spirosoma koreense]
MTNAVYNDGEQEHENRDPIDTMHHPQVYTRRMARVGFSKYPQKVGENRPYFKIIDESVHKN